MKSSKFTFFNFEVKINKLSLLFFLIPFSNFLSAQSLLDQKINFSINNITVSGALLELSEVADIPIAFNSNFFNKEKKIEINAKSETLNNVLKKILTGTGVIFKLNNGRLILYEKPKEEFTLSGFIRDATSGEGLVLATIYEVHSGRGVTTNDYGFFSLLLLEGEIELQVSYIGYQTKTERFNLNKNTRIKTDLQPSLTLVEVVVTDRNLPKTHRRFLPGKGIGINAKEMQETPAMAGESDVLRYMQLQPGVQSGADGFAGLHVRGGNTDQNLVLLDGVPVYNPSHTLGMFSIFNTQTIKSARLVKDGFSAKYGGRLSSVMDIRTKEGNTEAFGMGAEIGTLASKLVLEGPIKKGKSGFLISLRRTHLDEWIKNKSRKNKSKNLEDGETNYAFYDINAKMHIHLSRNDHLFFSLYSGRDDFKDKSGWEFEDYGGIYKYNYQQKLNWGNDIAALRWNHLFNDKLFFNTTLTFSEYNYTSQNSIYDFEDSFFDFINYNYYTRFDSKIRDASLKTDVEFYPNEQHHVSFGVGGTYRQFQPGLIEVEDEDFLNPDEIEFVEDTIEGLFFPDTFFARELSVYIEDQIKLNKKTTLSIGVHGAGFLTNEKDYFSIQPRLGIYFFPNKTFSFSATLSNMTQFLHVVTSSGSGFPNDLWVPSTAFVEPQQAWQAAVSGTVVFGKGWSLKLEGYYKRLDNLLSYKEEATLPSLFETDPRFWESEVTVGEGWAYGGEGQLKCSDGIITGWLSLAYAYSVRQFDEINNGEKYNYRYQHPFSGNLFLAHQITKHISISAAYEYGSGQPITLVKSEFLFIPLDNLAPAPEDQIGKINGYKMPAYHRLDLSILFKWGKNKWKHRLNIGAYNVYNQSNPYFIYYYEDLDFPELNGLEEQRALPLLPSVNYGVKF